jgi:beta-glucosidase
MNRRGKEQCKTDFAAMVRANNDLYMVVPKGENFEYKENTK